MTRARSTALGVLYAAGAAVTFAIYMVASERAGQRYESVTTLLWAFAFASLFWAVVSRGGAFPFEPTLDALARLGVIVIGTLLPFICVVAALRHLPAPRAAVAATLEPVLAAVSRGGCTTSIWRPSSSPAARWSWGRSSGCSRTAPTWRPSWLRRCGKHVEGRLTAWHRPRLWLECGAPLPAFLEEGNPLASRWLAVAGCLVAVSALGACGSDDDNGSSSSGTSASGGGGTKNVKIYHQPPVRRDRPSADGRRRQGREARPVAGEQHRSVLQDQLPAARRLDCPGWSVGSGPDVDQRAQGCAGQGDRRLHRRVQLRCVGDLDPDHQPGGPDADQPVEHGARADEGPGPERQGCAWQVLPDRQAHVRACRRGGPHPGCRSGRLDEGAWRQEAVRRRTTSRFTARVLPRPRPMPRSCNGIEVAGNEGIDIKAPNYRALASKIKASGADAFFFGGITASNGVQLYKDVWAANPGIKLFGPDGVAETSFTSKSRRTLRRNVHHGRHDRPEGLPARRPEVLQGLQGQVRRRPRRSRTRSTGTRP